MVVDAVHPRARRQTATDSSTDRPTLPQAGTLPRPTLHALHPPEAGTAAPAVPAAAPADEDDEATEDNADDPEDEDAATFLLALREPGADPAPKSKTKKAPPVAIAWARRRRRTGLAGTPTSLVPDAGRGLGWQMGVTDLLADLAAGTAATVASYTIS